MNNLRGGMGYCHITEVDVVLCFSCLMFYFSYIIYIINKKQVKDI